MHSNRTAKSYPEVRINLDALRTYAKGSAPYLAVPIVENGSRRPAIFCRKHLLAAISAPVVSAVFNVETNAITLNGGPKAKYILRDLSVNNLYQVRCELEKWAERKRKTATVKNMPANLKQDAKRRQAIEKLEKRLGKIHVHKPTNPVCADRAERWDGSAIYMRDSVETWALQRAQRKALGRLYGKYVAHLYKPRGRFPWADVNQDIETAGMRLDSYNAWSRIRTRVAHKGMDIPEYLKALPQFVGLARKPWDLTAWDFTTARESYVRDRQYYFESKHEHDLLTAQIANLKASAKPLALEQAEIAA
jgi:hypothetical protein